MDDQHGREGSSDLVPLKFKPGVYFRHILEELEEQGCLILRQPGRTVIERTMPDGSRRRTVSICADDQEMTATVVRSIVGPLGFNLRDVGYDFLIGSDPEIN